MITIMPIIPDVLQDLGDELNLSAEGPVWGYIASDGIDMLGYIIVEKHTYIRIIALLADSSDIADGLLRRALYPFFEKNIPHYAFSCECPVILPAVYQRSGLGQIKDIFTCPCQNQK